MKEIKPGGRPSQRIAWWAGKTVFCKICQCEQELETTDLPTDTEVERRIDGKRSAWFKCPTNMKGWKCPGVLKLVTWGVTRGI